MTQVCKAKLLTQSIDFEGYTTYVFVDLDAKTNRYIMCVRFPNWNTDAIQNGDIGFLSYKTIEGGKDKFFNQETSQFEVYKYNDIHFLNFIKENQTQDIIV